jgi:hypothetical protein
MLGPPSSQVTVTRGWCDDRDRKHLSCLGTFQWRRDASCRDTDLAVQRDKASPHSIEYMGGVMRPATITLSLVGLLFSGVFRVSLAQVPLPVTQSVPWHPCAKITAACTQAGFVPNGAKTGIGIQVDCIRPIMASTPQRAQAAKPLPQVDPQVVQACRVRNPDFGMDGGPIVAFSLRTQ